MRAVTAAIPGTATRNQRQDAADSVPVALATHARLPRHRLSAAAAVSAASSASAFALAVPPAAAAAADPPAADAEADATMSLRPRVSSHFRLPFFRPRSLSPLPSSSRRQAQAPPPTFGPHRPYSSHNSKDPRIKDLGRQIHDDFAQIREKYGKALLIAPPSPWSIV